ncbi:MAG: hypothetical protein ACO4CS_12340 [bacterium]
MTMHLEHPKFTTTGKRRGKQKWRSAEHKRQHEELHQSWTALVDSTKGKIVSSRPITRPFPKLAPPPGRTTNAHIPSLDTGLGNASKRANPVYTGDKIVGIGTMHKSNAVPIFSDSEAKEISSMRR